MHLKVFKLYVYSWSASFLLQKQCFNYWPQRSWNSVCWSLNILIYLFILLHSHYEKTLKHSHNAKIDYQRSIRRPRSTIMIVAQNQGTRVACLVAGERSRASERDGARRRAAEGGRAAAHAQLKRTYVIYICSVILVLFSYFYLLLRPC